jgi:hypothetical protein
MVILTHFVYFLLLFLGARRLVPFFGAVLGPFRKRFGFGAQRPSGPLLLHYGV